jgi:hypothetical protein
VSGTAQLAALLREEGGLLGEALRPEAIGDESLLAGVPEGPYALTLAALREGYLLHYADGRAIDGEDADLALLGGDRLSALALAELAALGDVGAVAQLAELISDCARAHAEADPARAGAAWEASAAAIARRA